jgi:hypothetical protein
MAPQVGLESTTLRLTVGSMHYAIALGSDQLQWIKALHLILPRLA